MPLPLDRAILWTPRGAQDSGTGPSFPEGAYPLFLEHDMLAGVNRHLDRIEREPRFGFLLGRLCHCPEPGIDYAVVDTAVAAREILSEEASGAYIIRAWSEAQAVFSGHSGLLLGWYHSHYRSGLTPTEADRDTNARYFDAPWQLSIIVVPDRARPLGGVFRPSVGASGGDAARPMAFYELTPTPHGGDIGRAHSAVTWANYQAYPPAAPEAESPAEVEGPPAKAPAAEEEPPEKPPEEPRLAAADEEPSEPEAEEPEEPESPTRPRVALWELGEGAEAGAEAPGDASSRQGATGTPDVRIPPESDRHAPPRRAAPSPPPRSMPPGDRSLREVPLVMPGEKAEMGLLPPRPRRMSRRISWRVVAAGVALLAVAVFFLWPEAPSVSTGRIDAGSSSTAGEAAVSSEVRRFLEDVEALEVAGERYAERAADFDAGRIGCDLLTTGYVAADEAYVRVAAAYRNPDVRSNPGAAAAYEQAGAEIARVNGHFDESGCPRP